MRAVRCGIYTSRRLEGNRDCLWAESLIFFIVFNTLAILLMTTRLLKKTMQKVATIPNQFSGQLSMQQFSLSAGCVVLVFVEPGG